MKHALCLTYSTGTSCFNLNHWSPLTGAYIVTVQEPGLKWTAVKVNENHQTASFHQRFTVWSLWQLLKGKRLALLQLLHLCVCVCVCASLGFSLWCVHSDGTRQTKSPKIHSLKISKYLYIIDICQNIWPERALFECWMVQRQRVVDFVHQQKASFLWNMQIKWTYTRDV